MERIEHTLVWFGCASSLLCRSVAATLYLFEHAALENAIILREMCVSTRPPLFIATIDSFNIGDMNEVDDQYCYTEDDWTGGAVWKGGEFLARTLLETPSLVHGLRVLELGAGTGLAGLAAAAAGAADVTITDRSPSHASANVLLNPLLAAKVRVRGLQWAHDEQLLKALLPGGPVDVVIAGDVVYPHNTESLTDMLRTLGNATVAGRGVALLSYVERSPEVTALLHSHVRDLGCRCTRHALSARVWLYTLSNWQRESPGSRVDCHTLPMPVSPLCSAG